MKQALFILAAFLLIAPSIVMGQDFEVVNAPGGEITTTTFVTIGVETRLDTFVRVQNKTTSPLAITLSITGKWTIKLPLTLTLPASGTLDIPVSIKSSHIGRSRSSLSITSTNTVAIVMLRQDKFPNITDSSGLFYYDDLQIPKSTSSCLPIRATNTTSEPMNIYGYNMYFDGPLGYLTIDTLIPSSYVILPGESVTLMQVCFKGPPNLQNDGMYTINYSIRGQTRELQIYATYSTVVDTILLKPCVEMPEETRIVGPTIFNGTSEITVLLKSNRYTKQTISKVSFPDDVDGVFHLKGNPLPFDIAPLASAPLTFEFTPTLTKPLIKDRFSSRVIVDGSQCSIGSFSLAGLALLPTADSISTPLFPDKEYVLGMSSSAPSFSQDFHFVNNGLTNTKIVSVGLADPSPEFVLTNITPTNTLPFTLLPGEKMTVSVLFTPSQVGKVFFNQLVITTEQGIQSVSYPLQGLRTTTSGVHESSEPSVSVSLTPNPASASVTVSVKDAGQIDGAAMTDELGKTIFYYNQPQQPEWKWELNPTRIAAGTYFIRINGKTVEGKPFVATKRLVVQ